MSYKTIVVHLDPGRHCAKRVDFAARLAAGFDAHLVGLYAVQPQSLPGYVRAELGPEYLQRVRDLEAERVEAASVKFHDQANRAGLGGAEFRAESADPVEALALHARYADLLVLGQSSPDDDYSILPREFPELAVMEAGRPALLVPYAGSFPVVGERVLVAWNASREATRAIAGALPLLKRAKKVTVLAANPASVGGHGEIPGADIAVYLARHGVMAEASRSVMNGIEVGTGLLSRAADLGIDLIVSGCYGHSRVREMVLGGVTRTLFQEMTVPVLMAH